jgi:hypothetical protein
LAACLPIMHVPALWLAAGSPLSIKRAEGMEPAETRVEAFGRGQIGCVEGRQAGCQPVGSRQAVIVGEGDDRSGSGAPAQVAGRSRALGVERRQVVQGRGGVGCE